MQGFTVGMLMIAMGGISIGIGPRAAIPPVGWTIAVLLIVSGALLFLRRKATFWLAVFSSVVLMMSGLLALLGKVALALPLPPALSCGIGLYLLLRLFLGKRMLVPRVRKSVPVEESVE